jgi:glutathione S-transferase
LTKLLSDLEGFPNQRDFLFGKRKICLALKHNDSESILEQLLFIHACFVIQFRDKVGVLAFTKQPMDVEKVTAAKAEVTRSVTHLADYFLQDKQFIGGSKMSVADILGVCELYQLHAVNELDNLVKSNPKVKAWFERVVKAIGAEWTPGNVEIDSFREKYMKA